MSIAHILHLHSLMHLSGRGPLSKCTAAEESSKDACNGNEGQDGEDAEVVPVRDNECFDGCETGDEADSAA